MKKTITVVITSLLTILIFYASDTKADACIFQGDTVKCLKRSLAFQDSENKYITGDTDDPRVVSKDGIPGDVYIRAGTGQMFIKQIAGDNTDWDLSTVPTIGTNGQVLTVVAGVSEWATPTGGGVSVVDGFGSVSAVDASSVNNATVLDGRVTTNTSGLSGLEIRVSASEASITVNDSKVSADGLVTTHSDVTSSGSGIIITAAERTKLAGIEALAEVNPTSTTELTEGTNLYFTDARVEASPAVATNTNKISADLTMNTHTDIDITTDPVTEGETLVWRTNKFVPEIISSGGGGDVVGPASSTDNAIARYNLATGKLLQNSSASIDDAGNINTNGSLRLGNSSTLGSITLESGFAGSGTGGLLTLSPSLMQDDPYIMNFPHHPGSVGDLMAIQAIGAGDSVSLDWVADLAVKGPFTSTDNAIARFDQATGRLIQDSDVTISDAGTITADTNLTVGNSNSARGAVTFRDSDSTGYVKISAPVDVPAGYVIHLPTEAAPSANQILESDAGGDLFWIPTPTAVATPGGPLELIQNNGDEPNAYSTTRVIQIIRLSGNGVSTSITLADHSVDGATMWLSNPAQAAGFGGATITFTHSDATIAIEIGEAAFFSWNQYTGWDLIFDGTLP